MVKNYQVKLWVNIRVPVIVDVEAETEQEAEEIAREDGEQQELDFSCAEILRVEVDSAKESHGGPA